MNYRAPQGDRHWQANDYLLRISAIVLMLIALCLWVGPSVLRPDLFEDDAAHHVFWLYQYVDPTLFPNDITVEYLRTSAPLGYRLLYSGLAQVMDPLLATKLVAALVLALSGWLAWLIAGAIGSRDSELRGLLGVFALIVVVVVARQTGGVLPPLAFQRTFALPLVLLCLWALISRRYAWAGASWLFSGLFYPVMLPLLGLASGCVFLRDMWVERRMPQTWVLNGAMGAAALALAIFGMPSTEKLGPAFTYAQAITMPEFGPSGRLRLYSEGTWAWMRFHMTGLGWSPYLLLTVVGSVVLVIIRRQRWLIPIPAWALVGVGIGLWLLMRLFPEQTMFGLYLPNRHSRWAIAAFSVVALSSGIYLLIGMIDDRAARLLRMTPLLTAWAAPLLIAAVLLPHALDQWRKPVDRDLEATYRFIAGLPEDTLVAAHPTLANFIPLRAQHSVLASTETAMPWLQTYYRQMKPRVEASLRAAYATDMSQLDQQLEPYGVGVFVTGPPVWTATRYHEPYNSELVQELLSRGRSEGFALSAPPADRVLFRSGDYFVIRVDKGPEQQ